MKWGEGKQTNKNPQNWTSNYASKIDLYHTQKKIE